MCYCFHRGPGVNHAEQSCGSYPAEEMQQAAGSGSIMTELSNGLMTPFCCLMLHKSRINESVVKVVSRQQGLIRGDLVCY